MLFGQSTEESHDENIDFENYVMDEIKIDKDPKRVELLRILRNLAAIKEEKNIVKKSKK